MPFFRKRTLSLRKKYYASPTFVKNLLITADTQNKGYAVLLEDFRQNGIVPHIVFHSNEPSIHLELVEKNKGISLFSEHWLPILGSFHEVKVASVSDLRKRKIFMILKKINQKTLCRISLCNSFVRLSNPLLKY